MYRWIWSAGLLAAGCDGKDDTGDAEDTAVEEPFAPEEGAWDASALQELEDGCDLIDDEGETYSIDIAMTGESTMSLTGSELDLACTLTDMTFTCDDEVDVQDYTSEGVDVVLTITFSYDGLFSDAETGGLTYTVVGECEGADCGQLEKKIGFTLPCTSAATTELTFSG